MDAAGAEPKGSLLDKLSLGWALRLLTSSIGRKFVMGITGLALCGFLVVHLAGNLFLYAGPEKFNKYALGLHEQEWLPLAEAGLAARCLGLIARVIQIRQWGSVLQVGATGRSAGLPQGSGKAVRRVRVVPLRNDDESRDRLYQWASKRALRARRTLAGSDGPEASDLAVSCLWRRNDDVRPGCASRTPGVRRGFRLATTRKEEVVCNHDVKKTAAPRAAGMSVFTPAFRVVCAG